MQCKVIDNSEDKRIKEEKIQNALRERNRERLEKQRKEREKIVSTLTKRLEKENKDISKISEDEWEEMIEEYRNAKIAKKIDKARRDVAEKLIETVSEYSGMSKKEVIEFEEEANFEEFSGMVRDLIAEEAILSKKDKYKQLRESLIENYKTAIANCSSEKEKELYVNPDTYSTKELRLIDTGYLTDDYGRIYNNDIHGRVQMNECIYAINLLLKEYVQGDMLQGDLLRDAIEKTRELVNIFCYNKEAIQVMLDMFKTEWGCESAKIHSEYVRELVNAKACRIQKSVALQRSIIMDFQNQLMVILEMSRKDADEYGIKKALVSEIMIVVCKIESAYKMHYNKHHNGIMQKSKMFMEGAYTFLMDDKKEIVKFLEADKIHEIMYVKPEKKKYEKSIEAKERERERVDYTLELYVRSGIIDL